MQHRTIFGPPGTGKTSTLLQLVEDASKEVKTNEIGYFSFTRAAAAEANSRLPEGHDSTVSTLHSLAYRVCAINKAQVVTHEKLQDFSYLIGSEIQGKNIEYGGVSEGDEMLALLQKARNLERDIIEVMDETGTGISIAIMLHFQQGYTKWKDENGYKDFTDMLVDLATTDAEFGFKSIFIDEAQDLTPLQWRVVDHISHNTQSLTLAGDDDQALYGWAGVDVSHFLERADKGKKSVLSKSYRVPAAQFHMSQAVIRNVDTRYKKLYSPTREPGLISYAPDLRFVDVDPETDIMILFRNHSKSWEVEEWAIERGLRYEFLGTKVSWFHNRHAQGIRTYQALQRGLAVGMRAIDRLAPLIRDRHLRAEVANFNFKGMPAWDKALDIPDAMMDYYNKVDLHKPANVRLSTIHGSKGREADHVILMNAMGDLTWESMGDDEYRVWYVAVTRSKHQLTVIQGDNPMRLT